MKTTNTQTDEKLLRKDRQLNFILEYTTDICHGQELKNVVAKMRCHEIAGVFLRSQEAWCTHCIECARTQRRGACSIICNIFSSLHLPRYPYIALRNCVIFLTSFLSFC